MLWDATEAFTFQCRTRFPSANIFHALVSNRNTKFSSDLHHMWMIRLIIHVETFQRFSVAKIFKWDSIRGSIGFYLASRLGSQTKRDPKSCIQSEKHSQIIAPIQIESFNYFCWNSRWLLSRFKVRSRNSCENVTRNFHCNFKIPVFFLEQSRMCSAGADKKH